MVNTRGDEVIDCAGEPEAKRRTGQGLRYNDRRGHDQQHQHGGVNHQFGQRHACHRSREHAAHREREGVGRDGVIGVDEADSRLTPRRYGR